MFKTPTYLAGLTLAAGSLVGLNTYAFGGCGCSSSGEVVAQADQSQEDANILHIAADAGTFNTLIAAIDAAELTEALNGEGPFTVLAPSDEAFAALPEGTVESLLLPENQETLQQILLYHVIAGDVRSDTVVTLDEATTLQGSAISIEVQDGNVVLNGNSTVTAVDISASNGVIHVIDTVLLPPADATAAAE